jgi:hypothetical protein
MHPMTTHSLATDNQRRILAQAAEVRQARLATAGRPSRLARLLDVIRRTGARPAAHPEPRTATTGRA